MIRHKLKYNGLNIDIYPQTTMIGGEFLAIRISSEDFEAVGLFNHYINNLKQSIKLYQNEIAKEMDKNGILYNDKYKITSNMGLLMFQSLNNKH